MTKVPIKIHGWKDTEFGRRIDVKLFHTNSIPGEVFWSERWKNSYVVAEVEHGPRYEGERGIWKIGDKWVRCYSVNGAGEVRWDVPSHDLEYFDRMEEAGEEIKEDATCVEMMRACQFFGLEPA